METTNLDAFKANKIRPTKDGLKDSKRPGEDCTVLLGITNPHAFGLPDYLGYDIKQLKDSFRVLEVVLARKGRANGLCPLYFNGAINLYQELPLPNDVININKVYNRLEELKKNTIHKVFFLFNKNKVDKHIVKQKRVFNFANFLKKWRKF